MSSSVYFAECGGYIKIGVSEDPDKRVADMQVGNPRDICLLAVIPGGYPVERMAHYLLDAAQECVRGEWYRGEQTDRIVAMAVRDPYRLAWFLLHEVPRNECPVCDVRHADIATAVIHSHLSDVVNSEQKRKRESAKKRREESAQYGTHCGDDNCSRSHRIDGSHYSLDNKTRARELVEDGRFGGAGRGQGRKSSTKIIIEPNTFS